MNKFTNWLNEAYQKWCSDQPGEEDFLRFCAEIGASPKKVLGWLDGSLLPEEADLVGMTAILGEEIFQILNFPGVDPELLVIYRSFAHLGGEERGKVARAVLEIQRGITQNEQGINSEGIEKEIRNAFAKWGIDSKNN